MKKTKVLSYVLLPSLVMGAFSGFVGSYLGSRIFQASSVSEQTVETRVLNEESAVIDVVERTQESVVSIIATKDIPVFEQYFYNPFEGFGFDGFGVPRRGAQTGTEEVEVGSGSGFFVREDGLIVTNRHVLEDEEAEYSVILNNGEVLEAEVLARDTLFDLAFLQVEGGGYNPISFSVSELKVGQGAVAIGNALGEFSNTVSIGIVSGLGRNLQASSGYGSYVALNDVIQTDASINPGNSGGPLLDYAGNAIGVNVAVASNAENIGFAIPISAVQNALDSLEEHGEILRPFLGVRYVPITESLQEMNSLEYDYGALIVRGDTSQELAVIPGSPADKAGLSENDIILEIEGQKVGEEQPLNVMIQSFAIGETIILKVSSKGEEREVEVLLEEQK